MSTPLVGILCRFKDLYFSSCFSKTLSTLLFGFGRSWLQFTRPITSLTPFVLQTLFQSISYSVMSLGDSVETLLFPQTHCFPINYLLFNRKNSILLLEKSKKNKSVQLTWWHCERIVENVGKDKDELTPWSRKGSKQQGVKCRFWEVLFRRGVFMSTATFGESLDLFIMRWNLNDSRKFRSTNNNRQLFLHKTWKQMMCYFRVRAE